MCALMIPIIRARRNSSAFRGDLRQHGCFEPVTAARYGLNQVRPVLAERSPQLADALHEHVVGDGQTGPDRRKELLFRDKSSGIFDQEIQQIKCLWAQDDLASVRE